MCSVCKLFLYAVQDKRATKVKTLSSGSFKPEVTTGIKLFNLAALLNFPKLIGPNESNPDSETNHFLKKGYP